MDNSAGLVRMARRAAEMGPAYVALNKGLIARAAGSDRVDEAWLEDLARLRGVAPPAEVAAGLEQPTSGKVQLFGQDLGSLGEDGRARLRRMSSMPLVQCARIVPGPKA